MNEFRVTDQGELDLGLAAPPSSSALAARPRRVPAAAGAACPPAASCRLRRPQVPAGGAPDDDWPDDSWPAADWPEPGDDGDPESGPDDYEAWLAGLPAAVRADFLAGAWTGAGESIPAGFLHHLRAGPAGTGFAAGGVLDTLPPGPWLADALTTATATDGGGHGGLGESELIGVLCGWRRIASWAAAGEAAAVLTLAKRRSAADAAGPAGSRQAEHVIDEIAAALTLTGRSAGRLLTIASGLARLPDVLTALTAGGIDWPKACVFADELAVLDDAAVVAGIAGRYLGRAGAGGWTTGQLRAALRRAVLASDPGAADRRRDDARHDAAVTVWDEASGNAALAGRELPPAEVLTADARLTALAKWLQQRGTAGTISQLRAAVYTALLNGRPIDSLLPGPDAESPRQTPRRAGSGSTAAAATTGRARRTGTAMPGAEHPPRRPYPAAST